MMFEMAVDAIVSGDAQKLGALLRADRELVRARSTREHGSTLLHYVSANGVEDVRQKTPANIVEIAGMLLDAGADVNAESNAYGGRWTTLGLTATSCHPEKAGVQISLLELLLARGAAIDGPDGRSTVNACLRNGRGRAAEFLADRGARVDLEGAAGVGHVDLVERLFDAAPADQVRDGFSWACEFGRTDVVEFLLAKGVDVNAGTGLHWAAFGGHADIVRLLLARGAHVGVKDERFGSTPLGWALYAFSESPRPDLYEVIALLVRAGAEPEAAWYTGSDPRMIAALRGEAL
jgi:ankyrin repeat protein